MAIDLHAALMAERVSAGGDADRFDDHVVACILAAAVEEAAREGIPLAEATGLAGGELADLVATRFPGAVGLVDWAAAGDPEVSLEEDLLRDLLAAHARPAEGDAGRPGSPALAEVLVRLVARRAMRPDHLWQDLGLADRSELGRLLARHFPALHAGNTANMRWKKYFYRRLCEAEGFVLCSAPSCAVCSDFGACFGAEDGESRLARVRRAQESGRPSPRVDEIRRRIAAAE